MSHNTFGHLFRFTTWGESHGPAIGCVVDGCPPRIPLSETDIQTYLDQRKPGTSRFVTQRREPDAVKILSGVFEGQTTGTPISLLIENTDQRSRDYSEIKDRYRPGHADMSYDAKYGIRDYRGGGRSSARETANRVAAGAIARKILGDIKIRGAVVQIGEKKINPDNWDWDQTTQNPFWPAGWGAPVYGKLDSDLAMGMMSINAAKGVEIGAGFETAGMTGVQNADEMRNGDSGPSFLSNKSGGILGGISNGDEIIARVAIKPTSSMMQKTRSVTSKGEEIDVQTKGRHDPCVGIRAVPVAEAMMAVVLADHKLRHRGQVG